MLQLEAKTNRRTPASRARRATSTVAWWLNVAVTSPNTFPIAASAQLRGSRTRGGRCDYAPKGSLLTRADLELERGSVTLPDEQVP